MNALKCDRCGKFYEEFTCLSAYTVAKRSCYEEYGFNLDLCPECTQELEKWLGVENK